MVQRTGVEPADPLRVLVAIVLPPLGVAMEVGLGGHFWLNILLAICGFIPGIVHAVYVMFFATPPSPDEMRHQLDSLTNYYGQWRS